MKLFVKNMVCNHCKMVVKSELEKLGLHNSVVDFCEAHVAEELSPEQWNKLDEALKKSGLELIDDKKTALSEKIKTLIIEMIRYSDDILKINLSDYLTEKLKHHYTYLSNVFSEINGITIEKFFIAQRIEQIKELLIIDNLSLSEIAFNLHYSSQAHLSKQFKDITGMTPTRFRQLRQKSEPEQE